MQERHALSLSLSLSLTVLAQDAINSAALAQIACVAPLPFAAGRGGGGSSYVVVGVGQGPNHFSLFPKRASGPWSDEQWSSCESCQSCEKLGIRLMKRGQKDHN
ncbi:hypothetical protein IAQ61_004686, partial [Plenodomus lingam]|uniref:uncharacterized protein n=1 Tax=Leptosphaeria maculans TaxID=5022 RepID=UPI00331FA4DF